MNQYINSMFQVLDVKVPACIYTGTQLTLIEAYGPFY